MTEPLDFRQSSIAGSADNLTVNASTERSCSPLGDTSWNSNTLLLESATNSQESVADVANPVAKELVDVTSESDSSSWSSDTPLLGVNSVQNGLSGPNISAQFYAPLANEMEVNNSVTTPHLCTISETSEIGSVEKAQLYAPNLDTPFEEKSTVEDLHDNFEKLVSRSEGNTLNVEKSIVTDLCRPNEGHTNSLLEHPFNVENEVLKCAPIGVFGSGWEFGSMCSMNLSSANDIRSRLGTMEGRTFHNPSSVGAQQRLLSKILADKLGNTEFGKGSEKDLTVGFLEPLSETFVEPTENKNMKNLLVLSFGITLLHIAANGLRNLQSSLNSENGLGVFSLATLCGAFMIGSLTSRFVVEKFRPKICIIVAVLGHLVYIVANYYPKFYTIIPASIIQGSCSALMWNAVCTYITETGLNEASRKTKSSNSVLSRYFGIFFLILQSSMVIGNLLSSIILSQTGTLDLPTAAPLPYVFNQTGLNSSIPSEATLAISNNAKFTSVDLTTTILDGINNYTVDKITSKPLCGAAYCALDATLTANKLKVSTMQKSIIIGTYSVCAIFAIVVIQLFLDQLPNYVSHTPSLKFALKQTASVLGMMFDRQFCFIVMLCLYTVIGNGFVVADVLKMFITCPLGMEMVGYSMICFGIMASISSYVFGRLAKCTGNLAAFITAFAGCSLATPCLAVMLISVILISV